MLTSKPESREVAIVPRPPQSLTASRTLQPPRQTRACVWLPLSVQPFQCRVAQQCVAFSACLPISRTLAPLKAIACAQRRPSLPSPITATRVGFDSNAFHDAAGGSQRFRENGVLINYHVRNGQKVLPAGAAETQRARRRVQLCRGRSDFRSDADRLPRIVHTFRSPH